MRPQMQLPEPEPRQFLCDLALLISEARVPDVGSRGRVEGLHYPVFAGVVPPKVQPTLSSDAPEHVCDPENLSCAKAATLVSDMQNLWSRGLAAVIQVFLLPDHCSSNAECLSRAFLIECWSIRLIPHRDYTNQKLLPAHFLIQALRSYLHFSQLSAWLIASGGKSPENVVYRVFASAVETTEINHAVSGTAAPSFESHDFPLGLLGKTHVVCVSVESCQRSSEPPALLSCNCSSSSSSASNLIENMKDERWFSSAGGEPPGRVVRQLSKEKQQSLPQVTDTAGTTGTTARRVNVALSTSVVKSPICESTILSVDSDVVSAEAATASGHGNCSATDCEVAALLRGNFSSRAIPTDCSSEELNGCLNSFSEDPQSPCIGLQSSLAPVKFADTNALSSHSAGFLTSTPKRAGCSAATNMLFEHSDCMPSTSSQFSGCGSGNLYGHRTNRESSLTSAFNPIFDIDSDGQPVQASRVQRRLDNYSTVNDNVPSTAVASCTKSSCEGSPKLLPGFYGDHILQHAREKFYPRMDYARAKFFIPDDCVDESASIIPVKTPDNHASLEPFPLVYTSILSASPRTSENCATNELFRARPLPPRRRIRSTKILVSNDSPSQELAELLQTSALTSTNELDGALSSLCNEECNSSGHCSLFCSEADVSLGSCCSDSSGYETATISDLPSGCATCSCASPVAVLDSVTGLFDRASTSLSFSSISDSLSQWSLSHPFNSASLSVIPGVSCNSASTVAGTRDVNNCTVVPNAESIDQQLQRICANVASNSSSGDRAHEKAKENSVRQLRADLKSVSKSTSILEKLQRSCASIYGVKRATVASRFSGNVFGRFNERTGLPLSSSPAPLKRNQHSFDFEPSLSGVKAIKNALYYDAESGSSDSECGTPICKSAPAGTGLLGNFEESALNGRIKPYGSLDGFTLELGASGAFCPPHITLPLRTYFFDVSEDNAPSPYLGVCFLEALGKKGYHVPKRGTVQVTLFNPQQTVVKMFVVRYDLSDMPISSQTFVRQRTFFMPSLATTRMALDNRSWLRYLIHLRFATSKSGKLYLHSDIRMLFSRKTTELDVGNTDCSSDGENYELRSFTEMPRNPKYSSRKLGTNSTSGFSSSSDREIRI